VKVCEAANHVSIVVQEELPEIDWSKIVGLRNKLAHDYGEILAQRVWLIAVNSVPKLQVPGLPQPLTVFTVNLNYNHTGVRNTVTL
jgi:hypothetical protein